MLTKSTDWQTLKKPARREGKPANKGAYTDVSDRNLQVWPTKQAEISSSSEVICEISAFAGFVSDLNPSGGEAV